MMERTKVHFNG